MQIILYYSICLTNLLEIIDLLISIIFLLVIYLISNFKYEFYVK